MSELTSEKIAKALKGAGLSSKQRIEKAQEAWSNDAIFFPNKDDFLFDWICSAFAKPNMKKLDDCCLLQLSYWALLTDLLHYYAEKARLDPKRNVPTVHANIVLSVSTLLQQLDKSHLDKPQQRIEFYTAVHTCLEILFSDTFALSYRPAFEHVSTAVDQVLATMTTQIDLCNRNETNTVESNALYQLALTAQVLLKKYDSQLVLAANQKKIFSSIVDKSLVKFLGVRRRINLLSSTNDTANISHIITDIIRHALFHADTVLEYTSVLKDVIATDNTTTTSGNVKQTNYVVKLFETLEAMVSNTKDKEQMLDAVDITPTLFSAFLDAFRQKRNTSTSAMQDISRMAEFGIFVYLLKILSCIKETHVAVYLESLCRLLKELLQWNVYTARNDDIAKSQQLVLNEIADNVVIYLDDSKRYDQALVLDVADALLQIDLSLIESRIQALWPSMLNPKANAYESCLKFSTSVLHTYSASRQMDVFVTDIIKNIGQMEADDVYTLLTKPLFTRDFLNEFSALVTKSMPAAQALGIFNELQTALISNVYTPKDKPVSKKQKKSTFVPTKSDALLITIYFVEFTNALKLNQHQLKSFESSVVGVFEQFVKPSIQAWIKTKDNIEATILPAMRIHSTLITAFFETYTSKLSKEDWEWLATLYLAVFHHSVKLDTLGSRIVAVTCANNMLQHVYYASLAQNKAAEQTTDLVTAVVDFVTKSEKKTTWFENTEWNGVMLDLSTQNTVKLACWKLISDEWFESVARFADGSRAEKIANIIFKSLTNDTHADTLVSAQHLSKTLLRSANFYEAKCFKDCSMSTILATLAECFKTKLVKSSAGELSTMAAKMIASIDLSKPLAMDQKDIQALSAAVQAREDAMDQDVSATSTDNVNKISTLLKLVLLFPNEYFEKNERPQALYLATLVDIWSVNCQDADQVARMKVSLMCRTLHMRFMGYFSVNSILGLDSNMLDWLVMSNQTYASSSSLDLYSSLDSVTNELDLNILRKIILSAGAKVPEEHAVNYFKETLQRRVQDLGQSPELAKLINLLRAINLALSTRKAADVDLSNTIYAVDTVSQVSKYIIASLTRAKSTIATILDQVKSKPKETSSIVQEKTTIFDNMKRIFHLTRLLQEYARIVGPTVDEAIQAEELSKTLTALASPFIQFLQSALLSGKAQNNAVLNMTTEFIAAFCSILSRYQQVDTTKRVLAAIWFVYTLVYSTGDKESLEVLSNAFASWIQSLSKEQYTIVLQSFVEQAEEEADKRQDVAKKQHHLVFLSLFSLLLTHCTDSEKGRLRKQIPSFVLKMSLIAGRTTSLKYLQHMLKMLIQLTGDQSYHFSDYDASIILSCLLQVAHPTAPERFRGQMNHDIAQSIFSDVCSVLSNLVSHHKDQVVYMMPPFVAFVQSLLHCFKSTHVSLVSSTNTMNSNSRKRKHNSTTDAKESSKSYTGRTIPLIYEFTPLDDTSAQRFARILTTIPQKQHTTQQQKNAKSAQTLQKMIAKHTPSILIEYFTVQSNPTMSVVHPSTKSILTQALYDILDLCSEADRTFILNCLDTPGKALFKSFYTNWKDNHKYTGQ
ncbi:BHLH domain-containing protein [Mucor velutinosus]|uniref:BHLH domain-containing protein n=1 Tax=Mucor velutinosus TaxID=708070 RepID=A0AAN7I2H8_9FUNG|nr:BHLH domain-containing protein [Mucor velutinosus]